MNGFFKDIRQDRVIFVGFLSSFILVFVTCIYILLNYSSLPPLVPLFNQLPWGNNRLGTTILIFIPIIIASFVSTVNIIISSIVYKRVQIVPRMLAVTSLLVSFLSFLFIIRTVQLVV